jgi:tetratricopeptide (TPR) repeat protein/tRNA A-37 threonylcarbamoyl transferase component Bud32
MATRWQDVERVLDATLDSDPSQWSAILDARCGDDRDLRREVEALLERYSGAQRFLESPPAAAAAALVREAQATPASWDGRRVGVYRLVRQIGQGGTARVFLAERDDGEFTQRVALKLLRPGHDSEIDQGRFRAERQILASLSHPNIARLLDGGVTEDGLPYLVMELVDGQPIDQYCATHALPIRKRLEMFLTVAEATQYAHRSLVVHRDLKPSNILVTADGHVKLLDFGLAKLLEPSAGGAAATLTTQRWMTPEYAAPEQVLGEAATTLTDVYQLGVVLYELLTGRLPFGTRQQSAYDLQRAILEQEAALPSSVAAHSALRGDLDAIVLKALRKEPEQRYASAQDLADDIRRSLSGHAVLARKQTAVYRARRFARRHAWGLAAATAIVIMVGAYVVTVTVQRARVERALAEAKTEAQKAEQVTDLILRLFEADQNTSFADSITVREILNRGLARTQQLVGQPVIRAQLLDVVGQLRAQWGDHDRARATLEEALTARRQALGDDHADVATSLHNLADAASRRRDVATAIRLRREALAIRRKALAPSDPLTLRTLYLLAKALQESGDTAAARPLYDEWIAAVSRQPSETTPAFADQLVDLGQMLETRGDLDGAERLYRQALSTRRTIFGTRHPTIGTALTRLGDVAQAKGDLGRSERLLREAVTVVRPASARDHRELVSALHSLAYVLRSSQRWDEAEALHREMVELVRKFHGEHVVLAHMLEDLGSLYRERGAYERAEPLLREAVRIYTARLGSSNIMARRAGVDLGDVLRARGAYADAERLLLEGYAAFRDRHTPKAWGNPKGLALESLVKLYEAQAREADAAKYRALRDSVRTPTR